MLNFLYVDFLATSTEGLCNYLKLRNHLEIWIYSKNKNSNNGERVKLILLDQTVGLDCIVRYDITKLLILYLAVPDMFRKIDIFMALDPRTVPTSLCISVSLNLHPNKLQKQQTF